MIKNKSQVILTIIYISCLALTAGCANDAEATKSNPTVLECTNENNQWVTVARRGNIKSEPLLNWKTMEFGDNYTPAERCKIVSEKLTTFIVSNGGRLENLNLKTGMVNNHRVICAVINFSQECDQNNIVLTLNKDNSKNSDETLAVFDKFAKGQPTSPIYENGSSSPPVIPMNLSVKSSATKTKSTPQRW